MDNFCRHSLLSRDMKPLLVCLALPLLTSSLFGRVPAEEEN